MNTLSQALVDYLAVRRALGYNLARAERLLAQFLAYLEDRGEERVTAEAALSWATLPAGAHRSWISSRLSIVRRFAAHLHAIDPATEVLPPNWLPGRNPRATPYLYSEQDIAAVMTAAAILRTSHRIATYRTLIALLVVTGMRIAEAIGLDRDDFDAINGVLTIRNGKFGKSRELPLHPSTMKALSDYLNRTDRPSRRASTSAFFVSTAGTRLLYSNVQNTFHRLVCLAGLTPRSACCRPRLHDLRHYSGTRIIPATEPR